MEELKYYEFNIETKEEILRDLTPEEKEHALKLKEENEKKIAQEENERLIKEQAEKVVKDALEVKLAALGLDLETIKAIAKLG